MASHRRERFGVEWGVAFCAAAAILATGTSAWAQDVTANTEPGHVVPSVLMHMSGRSVGPASHLGSGRLAYSVTPGVTWRTRSRGAWKGALGAGVVIETHTLARGAWATYFMPTMRLGASYHVAEASEAASTLSEVSPELFPAFQVYGLVGMRAQRVGSPGSVRLGLGASSPYLLGAGSLLAGLPSSYEVVYETSRRPGGDGSLWVRMGLGF